jgi:hypothetical protein
VALIGAVPASIGTTPTVQLRVPFDCAARVQDEPEPEKNVDPLLENETVPPGGVLEALSVTVAVQALAWPGATLEGEQATAV